MTKHLIAVMTCSKRGYVAKANAQRATWVPLMHALGFDVLFFQGVDGEGNGGPADVVTFDVPDGYEGIPLKVKAICQYAVMHGYDFVTKIDDDVYIVPNRFAALSFKGTDYVGRFRGPCGNYPAHFASGFCYTLSRHAAMFVAEAKWNQDWMDERWIACTLAHNKVFGHTDVASYMVTGPFHKPASIITPMRKGAAYCQYGPEAMHEMHKIFADAEVLAPPTLTPAPRMAVTAAQLFRPPTDTIPKEKLARD